MIWMDLLGDEAVIAKLNRLDDVIRAKAVKAVTRSVQKVATHATEEMAKPKHGALYTTYFYSVGRGYERRVRPGRRRDAPHRASAPDEYPAKDTGELMEGIWSEVEDMLAGISMEHMDADLTLNLNDLVEAEGQITGYVGSDAPHARYVEYKAIEWGGRPYLRRSLTENMDDVRSIFHEELVGPITL